MIKTYKIRLYPTKEQEERIWKQVHACRFIWNYMLSLQQEVYKKGEKHLSGFDMMTLLPDLKRNDNYDWLSEASSFSLQKICSDLDKAYKNFFKKKSKYPNFKSKKKSKISFPTRVKFFFESRTVRIEKVGKVKYRTDFIFGNTDKVKILNPRISNIKGKWILSFSVECDNQTFLLTDINMGIDLGIKDLAVAEFNGEKLVFHNINKSKKMKKLNKKLIRRQRRISRKYEMNRIGNRYIKTNNIVREEEKLRKLYWHIAGIRLNYIHQITHNLVFMFPEKVIMEDLNVLGMMKNKHLSKSIHEQCFNEFIRQMKYKCEWYGIEFIQANRFYPSSKICSGCGCVKSNLKLSDRTYVCEECGLVIDRDYNAAVNLSRYVI